MSNASESSNVARRSLLINTLINTGSRDVPIDRTYLLFFFLFLSTEVIRFIDDRRSSFKGKLRVWKLTLLFLMVVIKELNDGSIIVNAAAYITNSILTHRKAKIA